MLALKHFFAGRKSTVLLLDDLSSAAPAASADPAQAALLREGLRAFMQKHHPAAFAARNVALDNTGIVEVAHDARAAGEGRARDAWHVVRVNDAAHLEDGGLRGV